MSAIKAIGYAAVITAVSAVMLTIRRRLPTVEQAVVGCIMMFAVAFFVFKFLVKKGDW